MHEAFEGLRSGWSRLTSAAGDDDQGLNIPASRMFRSSIL